MEIVGAWKCDKSLSRCTYPEKQQTEEAKPANSKVFVEEISCRQLTLVSRIHMDCVCAMARLLAWKKVCYCRYFVDFV